MPEDTTASSFWRDTYLCVHSLVLRLDFPDYKYNYRSFQIKPHGTFNLTRRRLPRQDWGVPGQLALGLLPAGPRGRARGGGRAFSVCPWRSRRHCRERVGAGAARQVPAPGARVLSSASFFSRTARWALGGCSWRAFSAPWVGGEGAPPPRAGQAGVVPAGARGPWVLGGEHPQGPPRGLPRRSRDADSAGFVSPKALRTAGGAG